MNILIIFPENKVRESIAFTLEGRFGAKTYSYKSPIECFPILETTPPTTINLCIVDHPNGSQALFNYFKTKDIKIPTIICPLTLSRVEDAFHDANIIGLITLERLTDDIVPLMEQFIKSQGVILMDESSFTRIKTDLLLQIGVLPCDIYIKLSDRKYLKFFREGDRFELSDHQRITYQKKLEYLYVKREQTAAIVGRIKNDILRQLDVKKLNEEQLAQNTRRVYETVQNFVNRVGPTAETQQLVRASIHANLKVIGRNPTLKQTLAFLSYQRDQYIAAHSLSLAQISCALAAQMGWNSPSTFSKLQYASFFHDITLENHDLAQIETLSELAKFKDEFSQEEILALRLHPVHSAQLSAKFTEIPPDVDVLIRQHHERPDGSGFPHSLTANRINPLSCLFIVAHELVTQLFRKNGKLDYDAFMKMIHIKYNYGPFKAMIKALGEIEV